MSKFFFTGKSLFALGYPSLLTLKVFQLLQCCLNTGWHRFNTTILCRDTDSAVSMSPHFGQLWFSELIMIKFMRTLHWWEMRDVLIFCLPPCHYFHPAISVDISLSMYHTGCESWWRFHQLWNSAIYINCDRKKVFDDWWEAFLTINIKIYI